MTACGWYCSWEALLLSQRLHRFRRWLQITDRDQRLWMFRPAVFIEQIIDVRTGAFERPIARRNISLQLVHSMGCLRPVVHRNPNARLLRDHLALAVEGPATWAVAQVLRTRHGADVFHQAQNAVATGLASEDRFLERQLGAFHGVRQRGTMIHPAQDGRSYCAHHARPIRGLTNVEELLREFTRLGC